MYVLPLDDRPLMLMVVFSLSMWMVVWPAEYSAVMVCKGRDRGYKDFAHNAAVWSVDEDRFTSEEVSFAILYSKSHQNKQMKHVYMIRTCQQHGKLTGILNVRSVLS